jgi:Tfp pilus assembly protein PilO
MSISKENLVILCSLGALALIVVFLVMPSFDEFNLDRQIIVEKQASLEQAKIYNQQITDKNNQFKNEQLQELLSVLPKQEELSALLIQLEGLATGNGLIMESVDFSKIEQQPQAEAPGTDTGTDMSGTDSGLITAGPAPAPPYKILLVTMKLNGAYDAFKNYLEAVEKNKRIMDVTSLVLDNSSGLTQYFSFTVNLHVYYQ